MPFIFDLGQIRKQYNCKHYFETGLWDPTSDVSSKKALSAGFDTVHCIEIKDEWIESGKKIFENEISQGKYFLYQDDSCNMSKYLNNSFFTERTMFFLDAHLDHADLLKYDLKKKCPLLEELSAISKLERKDHIILIDDLRLITNNWAWNERSYGNIDFLQTIQDLITSINKDYKFTRLDGHVEKDVLCAYIE